MAKPRARDLGLDFLGETGPENAITDVPGVAVGFTTIVKGKGCLVEGTQRWGEQKTLPNRTFHKLTVAHHKDYVFAFSFFDSPAGQAEG